MILNPGILIQKCTNLNKSIKSIYYFITKYLANHFSKPILWYKLILAWYQIIRLNKKGESLKEKEKETETQSNYAAED